MKSLNLLAMLLVLSGRATCAEPPGAELIEVNKIWDQAPHNAFTDLVVWNGRFVCAFREGRGHVSADGKIRVLTSADSRAWKSVASVGLKGFDLRDAGLSTAPDGRLMLLGGAAPRKEDGGSAPTGTFVSFSIDGMGWTEPAIVVEPGRWLWRITWHDAKAYGVSYAAGIGHPFSALLTSDDGLHFDERVPKLLGNGYPTEATLRFDDDDTLYCLQRRDGDPPKNTAMLGTSQPPYTEWQWHDLRMFFGGPNFIHLPNGHWIAAGRILRDDGPKTELASLDVESKRLVPILQFPSGGDTSYPGLAWHDGRLWASYYSSHEGKASIYLAKVKLE